MINVEIKGVSLTLETDPELFSPSAIDTGTLAMLSRVEFSPDDKVLDLGCGCGVVGILAAKLIGAENVVLCDVSPKAVEVSRLNANRNGVGDLRIYQSDGLSGVPDTGFTLILSNPPYHTDFSVAKRFIEDGFKRLCVGEKMVMVTKRFDWYKNKLTSVFGGVMVEKIDGYNVFIAQKRGEQSPKKNKNKNGLSKKLAKKLKNKAHL